MSDLRLQEPLLDRWLSTVRSLPDAAFVPLRGTADLLLRPMVESEASTSIFLQEDFDPHAKVMNPIWRASAAYEGGMDLLRADYQMRRRQLTLFEGVNVLFLRVSEPEELMKQDRRRWIEDLVRSIIATETPYHRWRFAYPAGLEELPEPVLVTTEGAPALRDVQGRHDRADIVLWSREVMFVFYKKVEQYVFFQPDDRWFGPKARQLLHQGLRTG